MKSIIFYLLIFISISNADSIYNSKCVKHFYIENESLTIEYSNNTDLTVIPVDVETYTLLNENSGLWSYDSELDRCESSLYKNHGLTEMQFNFLSALVGLLSGFLISFIISKRF